MPQNAINLLDLDTAKASSVKFWLSSIRLKLYARQKIVECATVFVKISTSDMSESWKYI